MWDAIDSSYFVNHAHIVMALADMLGSAKLNGMAGHSAIYGDQFTMVLGACSSLAKGAKLSITQFHLLKIRSTIQIGQKHMTSQISQ